ncbi:hypothetical protein [Paraburkholderia sp. MM5477-R1]|uniref:hypothetical protein n=1 Tax=Paraburkholderia sp. MM5477-R1 TaxID=2991062 RepID=UPI003D1CBAF9
MPETVGTDTRPQPWESALSKLNDTVVKIVLVVRNRELSRPIDCMVSRQGMQKLQCWIGIVVDRKSDDACRLPPFPSTGVNALRALYLYQEMSAAHNHMRTVCEFCRTASSEPKNS